MNELLSPLTADEVETTIRAGVVSFGYDPTDWTTSDLFGATIRVAAVIIAGLSRLQAALANSAFLVTASGVWLTISAFLRFGVTRREAVKASGIVTLTNNGGGLFELDARDLIVSTASGIKFRNVDAFTLNVGPATTLDVLVESELAGVAYSAGIGDITVVEAPTLKNVTVTNAAALVGQDEQSDAELTDLAQTRLGLLSALGHADAYRFAALDATRSDGSAVGVNRAIIWDVPGDGNVTFRVATASGEVSGDDETVDTDLYDVRQAMIAVAQPRGVTVHVESAEAETLTLTNPVVYVSEAAADLTDSEIETLAEQIIQDVFASAPIGGWSGKVHKHLVTHALSDNLTGFRYLTDSGSPMTSGNWGVTVGYVPVLSVSGVFTVSRP